MATCETCARVSKRMSEHKTDDDDDEVFAKISTLVAHTSVEVIRKWVGDTSWPLLLLASIPR